MSKQEKNGSPPELRFPEFRDELDWEEKKLSHVCEINPSANGLPDFFVYIDLESVEGGQLLKKNIISKDDAPSRAQRLLKAGDVIFQTVRPYQKNNYLFLPSDDLDYVASTGYAQLRANESNTYLFQYIHSDRFVNRVLEKCTGSNYPAINSSELSEILVEIPRPEEQKKIAKFLSSVDDLITAQTQKFDAFKAYKKGLMQQLFPTEGETVPKRRFPQFREAKEWEPTTMGQIADFKSGGTPSKGNPAFWNGSIPWASAKDMKQLFLEDTEDHITIAAVDAGTKPAPAGTVLMLTRGMTLLKDIPICILNRQMSYNQDVKALLPKQGSDGRFLAYLMLGCKQRLLNLVDIAGHGTGRLDTDKLKALEVMLPQPAEQKRIADCLSSLEDLLIAQSQKISALRAYKKGLMQKLFPAKNEVSA